MAEGGVQTQPKKADKALFGNSAYRRYLKASGKTFEIDHNDPPRDKAFIKERDACRNVQCVKEVFARHTNDSLSGESRYFAR